MTTFLPYFLRNKWNADIVLGQRYLFSNKISMLQEFSSLYFEGCFISTSLLDAEEICALVYLAFFINESRLLILSCLSIPSKFALFFIGLVLLFIFFYFILWRWTFLQGFAFINKSKIVILTCQHYHLFNLLDLSTGKFN